jgi:hypothetical protein
MLEKNLEMRVIAAIKEASKSREEWEAIRPDLAPLDEAWVMFQNFASIVHQQGVVLAHLAIDPRTRSELTSKMPGATNRAPAWLDAHFEGQEAMTLELFFHGMAQTLTEQRVEILRVVSDQVSDPESIEGPLEEAPIPVGTEERSELMRGVGIAVAAHLKALVDIAYDLEVRLGLIE